MSASVLSEWLLRLLLAALLGALVGAERELRGHPAGVRTQALVALAAALFTGVGGSAFSGPAADPTRVAAGVATGVGFLGAGVILHYRGSVRGLTTAATLWLSAVVEELDLAPATIVANSMGGLWSLWTAIDHSDDVGRLVTVGCPATILGTSAPLPMRLATVPVVGALLMRLLPDSPEQVEKDLAMTNEDVSDLPELRDLMFEMRRIPGYDEMIRSLLSAAVHLGGARPEIALTSDQLAKIDQPVQMIWGNNDPFGSPRVGERAVEILPDSEFHVVSGGHMPWLDEPDAVADHIQTFLEGTSS